MKPAIRVEKLSKAYRLGTRPRGYQTNLTESLAGMARGFGWLMGRSRERPPANDFWALREVSFEVEPGEVVGIIGRNGAGKSTLLKILSQIVEPTSGRAEMRGRIGTLLEVGTGFHPELTGRENVYLSGSILGMKREEIARKFDEIVAFADIEQFIDTPVKRYSSGMYVRLAFAIAAHLQPEILILDEVLAVGDVQFQKRCLNKMKDVSQEGRTVLFVSHDMAAVRRLCPRAVMLSKGRVTAAGPTAEIVAKYLDTDGAIARPGQEVDLRDTVRSGGTREARYVRLSFKGTADGAVRSTGPLSITLTIQSDQPRELDRVAVMLCDRSGFKLLNCDTIRLERMIHLERGENVVTLKIPSLPLNPGYYLLGLWLARSPNSVFDYIETACEVEVEPPEDDFRPRPVADGVVWAEFDLAT